MVIDKRTLIRIVAPLVLAPLIAVGGSGCASSGGASVGTNPRDPLERYNRTIFEFNDRLDTYIMKPLAEGYRAVLPSMVRSGVRNFFGNLEDLWIGFNNLLQGKIDDGLSDWMRVGINSTIGLAGLLDVASETRLQKHNEDFGQTLGKWGVSSGPYFVVPFFGPSTVRDASALPVDIYANPIGLTASALSTTKEISIGHSMWGTNLVGKRADLLDAGNLVNEAALDRYAFIREAYLQRRRNLVYDGSPPPEKFEDEDPEPPAKPQASGTSGSAACLLETAVSVEAAALTVGEDVSNCSVAGNEGQEPVTLSASATADALLAQSYAVAGRGDFEE